MRSERWRSKDDVVVRWACWSLFDFALLALKKPLLSIGIIVLAGDHSGFEEACRW